MAENGGGGRWASGRNSIRLVVSGVPRGSAAVRRAFLPIPLLLGALCHSPTVPSVSKPLKYLLAIGWNR